MKLRFETLKKRLDLAEEPEFYSDSDFTLWL